ncbi:MAG: aspartate--tRNA ligase [Planctomycetota bacterium]|nr:aspartate--tRNA ligase [Planctomycetota bacterium]
METKRTHTCGELKKSNEGERVVLNGWVDSVRTYGSLQFVDLRDRYGITQTVFDESGGSDLLNRAKGLHLEYCVCISGTVRTRPEGQRNSERSTGDIEVLADGLKVFSRTRSQPFVIGDPEEPGEETRLKYRFLDLRREPMQKAMRVRSEVTHSIRSFMEGEGFWDIETPALGRSTPEGARDYLVPSRVNRGKFYALPQSPQQYKQLLMVGGVDKYYQIARCFRDEDPRADRQPEFTQFDVEMSFADREDVLSMSERLLKRVFSEVMGIELSTPFPRMSHAQAVEKYASDKPDLRFGLEVTTLDELLRGTDFKVFKNVLQGGGTVRALAAPGAAEWSRKQIKELETVCTSSGAKGMAWLKYISDEEFTGPILKFFSAGKALEMAKAMNANQGDVLCFVADKKQTANACMHNLRNYIGRTFNLYDREEFHFLWIVDFPLFKWNEDEGRYDSEHHPFTAPIPQDVAAFEQDKELIPSASYDLVMNGLELASGSQRIHEPEVQSKVFEVLKLDEETVRERFGFFIDALSYGTPPHAGIAFGLDRFVGLCLGHESIREVIAFPKNTRGIDMMNGAPGTVDREQLDELGIELSED